MCGFTTCVDDPRVNIRNGHRGSTSTPDLSENLQASIDILNHRGPDESGIWINDDSSVAFGHCRLSINDLSPSGRQPLTSDDGQIHAVVNGEIYDFERLRKLCTLNHGYQFTSDSDSELVLALYKIYGAPGFFKHLRGEFAFVICDERDGKRKIIAARDRYGIKPLVWTTTPESKILMASEIKAFLPLGWEPEWDVKAIATCAWQLDDRTLFKGVRKLLPGHWMEIEDGSVRISRYWDAEYEDKVRFSCHNSILQ